MISLRCQKDVLDVRVGDQVEISLAVADFSVFQAVIFGRRWPQGLGEDGEAGELDRDFTGLGGEQRAIRADEIAEIEVAEDVELFVTEDILLGIDLEAPGLIAHVDEHAFAHVAVRGDAAGDGHFAAFGVVIARPGDRFRPA